MALALVASVATLAASGCMRFGYGDRRGVTRADASTPAPDTPVDSGARAALDAGQDSAVGAQADSGGPAAGSGGGAAEADSGSPIAPMDAGQDTGTEPMPMDAGAADSGVIASPKCLARPGALFCDGFEAPDPDFDLWAYETITNGEVERSMARAHTGVWSLHASTVQGVGSQARQATMELARQMSGDVWMRFFNWVPASVQIQEHFSIGVISEEDYPWDGFELRLLPGDFVDLNTSSSLKVVDGMALGAIYPRDAWVCVELHLFIDPVLGFYEAYLDSALAVRSQGTDTTAAGGYSAAEVGIHYAPPDQGPVELFVDDVVVARSRIGCN